MSWLINVGLMFVISYAALAVLGFILKVWYLLFMFGWNLL